MDSSKFHLSLLTLEFQIEPRRPDWPRLRVLIDGQDAFAAVLPGWQGFDPGQMLGDDSPLLPTPLGQRVAVYTCSCGIAGCGVIAPWIAKSPDGRRVSWLDFRDFVGVFNGPTADTRDDPGQPLDLPELHFDPAQYEAEVRRVSADRSWETSRRRVARLVGERLLPVDLALPDGSRLRWVSPAWREEGVQLAFERRDAERYQQHLLHMQSDHDDPAEAADEIVAQLLGHDPATWLELYRWEEKPRR